LGGKDYETQFALRFPDGKTYTDEDGDATTESVFALSQAGVYSLKYSTKIDGEYLSKSYGFTVQEKLYSVSSEKSHVEYGEVKYPTLNGTDYVEKTGLDLTLSAGDTFRYNKIVDLSKGESLKPLLTFSALPSVDRELDVSGITLILTDAYDAKNTVEIKAKAIVDAGSQSGWDVAYVSACAPKAGQVTTGYAKGGSPEVQVNTIYGCPIWFPFYGSDWNKTSSALEHSMTISYDYDKKQV
jgi:hypothetical protein